MHIIELDIDKIFSVMFDHAQDCNDDYEMHTHDCYELFYLISGDVNYIINNKTYKIEQGHLLFTKPFEIHKTVLRSNKPYERIFIQFNDELIGWGKQLGIDLSFAFSDANRFTRHFHHKLVKNDELLYLLIKIEKCNHSEQLIDKTLLTVYLTELIIMINKAFLDERITENAMNIPDVIRNTLFYINDNFEKNLTLDFLANQFYINKIYLCRLFKRWTGLNLHEYIIYKRVDYAKELLRQKLSLSDVCIRSGFNNYSHFIRCFKQHVGYSPGLFKQLTK